MLSGLSPWFSSKQEAKQTPSPYFDTCPELKNVAALFEKLRKKKVELATAAAPQSDPDCIDSKKYVLVKEIVDEIDTRISAFNKEGKDPSNETELQRQLELCLDIADKLATTMRDSSKFKILNSYRNYKKPLAMGAATAAPIVGGIVAAATTGGLAGFAVLFGGGGTREAILWATNTDPIEADTVTVMKAIFSAAQEGIENIRALLSKPLIPS